MTSPAEQAEQADAQVSSTSRQARLSVQSASDVDRALEGLRGFGSETSGIQSWLRLDDERIVARLKTVDQVPLTRAQLNQLLILGHEAGMSDGCFSYYFLSPPSTGKHPYALKNFPGYPTDNDVRGDAISSLMRLYFGFYRMFVDGLLFFGNIRAAYRWLRDQTEEALGAFFERAMFDTDRMRKRGGYLPLAEIERKDLHLNSEIAQNYMSDASLKKLVEAWRSDREKSLPEILAAMNEEHAKIAIHSLSEKTFENTADLRGELSKLRKNSEVVRERARENTSLYLSMVDDLDVYVATSMREAHQFEQTADRCSQIFGEQNLRELNLRYFDPTLSAAERPQDKGLIECLMVKCAKALVYFAGDRDSFGKDAEAAMALSLGKPVIVLCDDSAKARLYREMHPLARLIDFNTGVAVGMLVTNDETQVPLLLERIFTNSMEYELSNNDGYLTLKDALTESVVRVQTNSKLITETFWNHYHRVSEPAR